MTELERMIKKLEEELEALDNTLAPDEHKQQLRDNLIRLKRVIPR